MTLTLCFMIGYMFFQISVQLTKVLLHTEDKYSIRGFLSLRQTTMVALAVTDCIPVRIITLVSTIIIATQLYRHIKHLFCFFTFYLIVFWDR